MIDEIWLQKLAKVQRKGADIGLLAEDEDFCFQEDWVLWMSEMRSVAQASVARYNNFTRSPRKLSLLDAMDPSKGFEILLGKASVRVQRSLNQVKIILTVLNGFEKQEKEILVLKAYSGPLHELLLECPRSQRDYSFEDVLKTALWELHKAYLE